MVSILLLVTFKFFSELSNNPWTKARAESTSSLLRESTHLRSPNSNFRSRFHKCASSLSSLLTSPNAKPISYPNSSSASTKAALLPTKCSAINVLIAHIPKSVSIKSFPSLANGCFSKTRKSKLKTKNLSINGMLSARTSLTVSKFSNNSSKSSKITYKKKYTHPKSSLISPTLCTVCGLKIASTKLLKWPWKSATNSKRSISSLTSQKRSRTSNKKDKRHKSHMTISLGRTSSVQISNMKRNKDLPMHWKPTKKAKNSQNMPWPFHNLLQNSFKVKSRNRNTKSRLKKSKSGTNCVSGIWSPSSTKHLLQKNNKNPKSRKCSKTLKPSPWNLQENKHPSL